MKKSKAILVILISCFYVISLNAQTDAGKFMLTGSSSLNFEATTSKYKSDVGDGTNGKGTSLTFSPQIGYFIIDGLAAGLRFDLEYESFKEEGAEDKESTSIFDVGPFVRYYVDLSKIKPFAEGALAIGSYTEKYGSDKDKSGIFAFQLKGGVAYFLNDNVAVEAGLGYRRASAKQTSDNPANYKNIMSSFIMEFGITIVL